MNNSNENFFVEILKFSLLTLIIVLPFRMYIAKPFIVDGASMSPTFETGNYLIVDQLSYKFQEPERGEVVIFKYPKDQTRFFIKRIIGLPQETVEINDGKITIYKENKPEGLELEEEYIQNWSGENTKYILEENEYFVMGDNRTNSSDSRFWGPLPENLIVGRAFLRLLPVNQISAFPGNFDY
ncbi:signal peptidase I [Candidatus Campbellbacteria bacterium RIFCSPLOWO2_02_FULL_35_11]|uniref:Signal peptidase I n=2 Tax=Candidatus Campbelliibacteriota TaxID=1752727 RepID=A0A1F5ENM6_9BACT|nr:MAG: signal peptidase I [Candidatus Campbellbacteria bacterium RIFCSPHIGHO2_12_FULL_35_10]OGD70242.1 MAG: signal peptidase I [Candidatus Campbellbacteria bacterium RIFCSPLOWO2_02_FULL_35_11]